MICPVEHDTQKLIQVLYLEDSKVDQRILHDKLSTRGFDVHVVDCFEDMHETGIIDVAVLDLCVAGMAGVLVPYRFAQGFPHIYESVRFCACGDRAIVGRGIWCDGLLLRWKAKKRKR